MMEDAGRTLHLHLFSFPPSFPDGRSFGSARREKRTENARRAKYAAGRCHPTFRGAEGRTFRAETDGKPNAGRRTSILSDALADRCKGCVPNSLLTSYRTSRTSLQCVPGKTLYSGEAKAGYRRANDKGQWWEAGASDKEGSEQNGKGRMPKKIQKRQANAGSH